MEITAAAPALPRLSELTPEETQDLFEDFGVKFSKSYPDVDEKAMRFEIFKRNLKRIDEVCTYVQSMVFRKWKKRLSVSPGLVFVFVYVCIIHARTYIVQQYRIYAS